MSAFFVFLIFRGAGESRPDRIFHKPRHHFLSFQSRDLPCQHGDFFVPRRVCFLLLLPAKGAEPVGQRPVHLAPFVGARGAAEEIFNHCVCVALSHIRIVPIIFQNPVILPLKK